MQDAPKDAIASARQMGEIYKTAIDRFIDGLDENFSRAVDMMMTSSNHVIVCGMGKSGLLGARYHRLLLRQEHRQSFCIRLKRSMVIWVKSANGDTVILISTWAKPKKLSAFCRH